MTGPQETAAAIADRVMALPVTKARRLVAIAGPPASGKTTLTHALRDELTARGSPAGIVAMDGFHLDNAILDARGLRARKGAPETFDLAGFAALLRRLTVEGEVIAPSFDRVRDVSVGSSEVITPDMTTVVVEGNYLLLDEPGWRDLRDLWSFSVQLSLPADLLEARLVERWLAHGFSEADAREKARNNDLPNAERVRRNGLQADLVLTG